MCGTRCREAVVPGFDGIKPQCSVVDFLWASQDSRRAAGPINAVGMRLGTGWKSMDTFDHQHAACFEIGEDAGLPAEGERCSSVGRRVGFTTSSSLRGARVVLGSRVLG